MAKLPRVTQKIFGSSAGFQQIAQFGSFAAGTPTYTTNVATVQALTNWLVGWVDAVEANNSPAIEDMNAAMYVFASQLAYIFQAGISEWDSGTTYYSGSLVNVPAVVFTVTSANATVGATYTNNTQTFTVLATIAAGTRLVCSVTGSPTASGTLTKSAGTGDATISFSSNTQFTQVYQSIADTNLNQAVTSTNYWTPYGLPLPGKPLQALQMNATGAFEQWGYGSWSEQVYTSSLDVPAGYNYNTGNATIPTGFALTVEGSMNCANSLALTGSGTFTVSGSGVLRIY